MEIHEFELAVLDKMLETQKQLSAEYPNLDSFSYARGCVDTVTVACEILGEELTNFNTPDPMTP